MGFLAMRLEAPGLDTYERNTRVRFGVVLSIGRRNILFSDCVEGDVDDETKTEDSIL
jgi:hypothetical protein